MDSRVNAAWGTLRVGLGLIAVAAGLDKFFNLLTQWTAYISPALSRVLPFSGRTFMHLVGIVEMAVGLAILTSWTRIGAYAAMVWLLLIAVNLVSSGRFLDVAARDVVLALSAFSLAKLSEVRHGAYIKENKEIAASGYRPAHPVP